jgi:serine/threonine protein kinase/tetratricopeptide (TPR) repeat protein
MGLAPGARLGHFEILSLLGAGGMGEVYRARDLRLDREVAIKVLPAGALATETARRRFRKEALALSKLDHPHVATVFEFDTEGDVDFLVMGLIPGTTLREKLGPGPLPEREVLRLGAQLADGLAAAHERGVVHRDVKPANLRITDEGRLRILDFGLASLHRDGPLDTKAGTSSLSVPEGVVGTPPYMAPEQIRGEPVDRRTDVYAAGAVLYEMATGRRPFLETGPLLYDAVLNRAPESPAAFSRSVSTGLEFVILKALEKDPSRRYQSARELLLDLERLLTPSSIARSPAARRRGRDWLWVGGAVSAVAAIVVGAWLWRPLVPREEPIRSLAVLPLQERVRDPSETFFAQGITDELITSLAKRRTLTVISRSSAQEAQRRYQSPREIARHLGVRALMEGTVQRTGDRLRMSVRLVDPFSGAVLWADSYERGQRGVYALQDEIARDVSNAIHGGAGAGGSETSRAARDANPRAYELLLKARFHRERYSREGIQKSIEYLDSAIDIDPEWAEAHAQLAISREIVALGFAGPADLESEMRLAEQATKVALALDPNNASAHFAAAARAQFQWKWQAAVREYERALELDPAHSNCWSEGAWLLAYLGDERALEWGERARTLDPLTPMVVGNLGIVYRLLDRPEQAVAHLKAALEIDPDFWPVQTSLGQVYLSTGRMDEAIAIFSGLVGQTPQKAALSGQDAAFLGAAYARAGRLGEARTVLKHLIEADVPERDPVSMAYIYDALGRRRDAVDQVVAAYERRERWLPFRAFGGQLPELEGDPRFERIRREIGFPARRTEQH